MLTHDYAFTAQFESNRSLFTPVMLRHRGPHGFGSPVGVVPCTSPGLAVLGVETCRLEHYILKSRGEGLSIGCSDTHWCHLG